MGTKRTGVSDSAFLELCENNSAAEVARRMGCNPRNVFQRRRSLEQKLKRPITFPSQQAHVAHFRPTEYSHRRQITITSGTIIVASDAHYWPGPASLMHRALVAFCKEYRPAVVIANGDVIDAPTVSRHPPIGWEKRPQLADEIEAAKERLHEIEKAAFKAEKIWNLGNHDARFETRIAQVAPEYAKIHGVHLRDHFPNWTPAWSTWINDSIVVKHRFKGGIHAAHNNTLWSGKTMVTGHLHSAKVSPFDDYNGTRYGIDGGCIADTDHKAFTDYTEDNPKNWRSGFVVLSFKGGLLMQPELVLKWSDDAVQFRGEVIRP